MTDITTFDLETFLMGAKQTASRLDSEFIVTDNATGKVLGGVGIIVARLIDEVEMAQDEITKLRDELIHQIGDLRECPWCGKAFIPHDATQQCAIDLLGLSKE